MSQFIRNKILTLKSVVEYSFWENAVQGTNCRLVMDILTIYMYPTHEQVRRTFCLFDTIICTRLPHMVT